MKARDCSVVMPPIYHFDIEGSPEMSKWGWHRASELHGALNNISVVNGGPPLSVWAIDEQFSHLHPQRGNVRGLNGFLKVINQEGNCVTLVSLGKNWMEMLVQHDFFIPAKIGTRLINEVKHPFRAQISKFINGARTLAR